MKWAFVAVLVSGCGVTRAGFHCESINAQTKLSTLPTNEFIAASDDRKSFWGLHGLYLTDEHSLQCCSNSTCDATACEAALSKLRVSVLDKPFSTDCGIDNRGWGMCHVIVDETDRIVATTYRCQD